MVEHILIHCAEYFHVRYQCFDVNDLGELFHAVSPDLIICFIQRAGLFYNISYDLYAFSVVLFRHYITCAFYGYVFYLLFVFCHIIYWFY